MDAIDLAFAPALEQAKLIREKEISPLEITQLYLDRISKLDSQLGSFFYVAAEQAIEDAKAKTEALTTRPKEELPPFFGVPIGVKDLNTVAGMPCSYGVKVLKKMVSPQDDGLVTTLRRSGFVLLGKLATAQIGALPYTEPPGFPPTRSPWNTAYTAGGSSGGAGAAVAAGLSAIAASSDAGGSVRIPALCCGLIGLKPSRGRVSNAPGGEYFGGFMVNGQIARSVRDAAALLDQMAGYVVGDLYWLPNPEESFLKEAEKPVPNLRIGLLREVPPLGLADTETNAVLETMAQQLTKLGHEIIEIDPQTFNSAELIDPFRVIWQTQMDVGIPGIFLEKMTRSLWLQAQFLKAGKYQQAQQTLQCLARKIVQACDPYDLVLTPTVMFEPPKIGAWSRLSTKKMFEQIVSWIAPSPLFNISGQPAISLPIGQRENGLPIGVQFVGRPAGEAMLLRLALQLESQGIMSVQVPSTMRNLQQS